MADFRAHYGIRLVDELEEISWFEFVCYLTSLPPESAFGRAIRAEREKPKDIESKEELQRHLASW